MARIRRECVAVEQLRKMISYNPETGALKWLPRTAESFKSARRNPEHRANVWNARYAGTPALAAIERWGYAHGDILGLRYKAHRVAWALYHGAWPDHEIDHINGDRADNRIANLRSATHQENMRNQTLSSANRSGVIGVCWNSRRNKWSAQIKVNKKKIHLGLFDDINAAAKVRKRAEIEHGFHPNHGKVAA